MKTSEFDFVIVGAGVIGLSIAWQLSNAGRVAVIERSEIGRQASWAGAGILPPANPDFAVHPLEKLHALSFRLHTEWSNRLARQTGIDNGHRQCGALFVARTVGEAAALAGQCHEWESCGIRCERLSAESAREKVTSLAPTAGIQSAAFVPDECQIRNPRHLKALEVACREQGVDFWTRQGRVELETDRNRLVAARTEAGQRIRGRRWCLAAGVWTEALARQLNVGISTLPVRGQMLLYRLPAPIESVVIYEGTRYIVPRADGHVLVGSTLEEAGFDNRTTESGLARLKSFASGLVEGLSDANLVKAWAGLRPASFDGLPYIGSAPDFENVWIATGHFRSGLLLSTGTAIIIRRMMLDQDPPWDVHPFRVDRG